MALRILIAALVAVSAMVGHAQPAKLKDVTIRGYVTEVNVADQLRNRGLPNHA